VAHLLCLRVKDTAQNPAHSQDIQPSNPQCNTQKATATATQLIGWSQAQHRLSWGANFPTLHKELYKRLLRCGTKNSACSALCMIAARQREGLTTRLDCTTPTQVSRQLLTTPRMLPHRLNQICSQSTAGTNHMLTLLHVASTAVLHSWLL
jgi:hypothetical protein